MSSILILFPFQGFSSRETDFHFYQFFFNFLRYSFSNFPLFYLYNIFAVYFPSNSSFLKFFFSILPNFSDCLTSILILSSNSAIAFLVFYKPFFFSQVLFSAVNLFYCTKYFTTLLIFILYSIFSTSHFFNSIYFYWFYFFYFLFFYLFSISHYLTNICCGNH